MRRASKSTLQKLRQEWDRPDIDDFALRLSSLMTQLEKYDDDGINEEKSVEKLLRVVPNKYL